MIVYVYRTPNERQGSIVILRSIIISYPLLLFFLFVFLIPDRYWFDDL